MLILAYLAEMSSEHPISKALKSMIRDQMTEQMEDAIKRYSLKEFQNCEGEGIVAKINDIQEDKVY